MTLAASRARETPQGTGEGRKTHAELHTDVVAEAKRLRRASPKNVRAMVLH